MKNSGIEWIGEIPDEWEVQRLKDIFYIIGGCGFKDSFQGNKHGDYPFCKASDINGAYAYLDSAQNCVNNDLVVSQHYKLIPESSILIAKIGEAMKKNHRKINLVKCIVDNNCQALCRKGGDNIKYLFYLLSQIDMAWFDNGGTIPNINNTKLLNFYVPFISVLSQKNIATFLDKQCAAVDRLIENQSKQIEKLKEYKQSVITEAVTKGLNPSVPMKDSGLKIGVIPTHWKIIQFKFVAKLSNGKEVTSDSGDIPVYGSGGVFKYTNDYLFNGVSLLMGRKGTIDNPMLVNGKFWTVDTMFYTSEIKRLLPKFLYYLAKSVLDYGYYKSGSVLPSMTQTEINNIRLTYPPIEEQQQIADYLDKKCEKIDKLIAIKQQKIEKLNEYKKSLIYEYVTGKKEVV